ncbi:TPA: TraR/DksA family transcriptional regulator [Klebsiella oxytoca]|uniref:TraR/DksA family transcriptional regulator n=1 Tax=Klebsiella oxytoca TaxID=571 RepID=A0AAN5RGM1_KLEOX|nr:TraR/DksA family transcriptional regulator [Klebsiella oxytoca]
MPDELDRDQEIYDRNLELLIEKNRFRKVSSASLYYCSLCGEPIPERRRRILPGIQTCTDCQEEIERRLKNR